MRLNASEKNHHAEDETAHHRVSVRWGRVYLLKGAAVIVETTAGRFRKITHVRSVVAYPSDERIIQRRERTGVVFSLRWPGTRAPLLLLLERENIVMKNARPAHLLRWLLLPWLALIYVWGLQLMIVPVAIESVRLSLVPEVCLTRLSDTSIIPFLSPSLVVLFTGSMLCHMGLYWVGLSRKMRPPWLWLYLAVQWLLLVAISLVVHTVKIAPLPEDFLSCLYLALIVAAISMSEHVRTIIAVVTSSLLLLAANTVALEALGGGNVLHFALQEWIWYVTIVLFVVGYSLLYLQQLRTQAQLQASAAKIEALTLTNERQRLARELHDTLAQGLAGVVMQLEVANARLSQNRTTAAQNIVQHMLHSARETLVEARSAIENLRIKTIGASALPAAIHQEIERFLLTSGIRCSLDMPSSLPMSPRVSEQVVRILCEGLTNIARHAQAQQAWVEMAQHDEQLSIEIRDDGIGFAPAAVAARPGHYGLIGVRERAHLVGGHVSIRSAPGRGTCLQVSLPLQRTGERHEGDQESNTKPGEGEQRDV